MQQLIETLKTEYAKYYRPQGGYKRQLLKEQLTPVGVYDYFSRLAVRVDELRKLPEMQMPLPAKSNVVGWMPYFPQHILQFKTELLHIADKALMLEDQEQLATAVDCAASIVEGMEAHAASCLQTWEAAGIKLSEDAKTIQRRGYTDKTDAGKNLRKSQTMKAAWKRNRQAFTKGIQKFNKSSAGKQFHRNLGRFNQLRVHSEKVELAENDILMLAKGVSSLLTHLLIEVQSTSITESRARGELLAGYRELFAIMDGCMNCLVEAHFDKNREVVENVLEIIDDYYSIAGV